MDYNYAINTWQGQFERSGVYANAEMQAKIAAKNLAEGKKDYRIIEQTEDGEWVLIQHEFTKDGYENTYNILDELYNSKEELVANTPEWMKKNIVNL